MENESTHLHRVLQNKPTLSKVKTIVSRDQASVFARNGNGSTALHVACWEKAPLKIVRYLVMKNDTALSIFNKFYETPFDTACRAGASMDVIRFLDDNSIFGPAIKTSEMNCLSLMHATCEPSVRLETVQYLVERNKRALSAVDQGKNTALHLACKKGASLEVIQFLAQGIGSASSLKAEDRSGNTPLHYLCKRAGVVSSADDVAVWLTTLQCVVDGYPKALEKRNYDMDTPLHCLVGSGPATLNDGSSTPPLLLVQYLVTQCPRALECMNCDSETPLHLLVKSNGPLDVVQYLAGTFPASSLVVDKSNQLPLDSVPCSEYAKSAFLELTTKAARSALTEALQGRWLDMPAGLFVSLLRHQESGDDGLSPPAARLRDNKEIRSWLWRRRNRRLVSGIAKMNMSGRAYFRLDAGNIDQGVRVLESVREEDTIDCLYLHLRENPLLVQSARPCIS